MAQVHAKTLLYVYIPAVRQRNGACLPTEKAPGAIAGSQDQHGSGVCSGSSPLEGLTNRISRLLRLRKRWAALGQFLQLPRVQNIFFGLDRQRGQLVRRMVAQLNSEQ